MAGITAAWTTPQTELTTRAAILRALLRETDMGVYGTTTAAGSTTTLVDTTRLAQYPDDRFNDGWIRGVTGSAAGQIRRVADFVQSTGTLTHVSGTAYGSGADYELWLPIYPTEVLDFLDDIMTNEVFLPSWSVLTECPDGDMEQNNITDWTEVNVSASKITSEPSMNGKRWLRLTTTSAGGYARSVVMSAPEEPRDYHLSALVYCGSGATATMTAYDETNSTALASVTTTSRAIRRLFVDFTAPTTCKQISIRLGASENSVATTWDDVCFYSPSQPDIRLPWWVKTRDQVREYYTLDPSSQSGNDEWDPALIGRRAPNWTTRQSRFGSGQLRAVNELRQGISGPMYIYGLRNETAWSSDTETKHVDQRLIVASLAVKCYERVINTAVLAGADATHYGRLRDMWDTKRVSMVRKLEEPESDMNSKVKRYVGTYRER